MQNLNANLTVSTQSKIDFADLTSQVEENVRKSSVKNGVVHVFPTGYKHPRLDRA
ncbi:MAG: hypothetical protein JSV12_04955 [Candidatus Bathyarchaeota archaeon]|nr:MAG: hypothetical protein JSV12_04955 [Candidatus Bathyarchaeota archaeon]